MYIYFHQLQHNWRFIADSTDALSYFSVVATCYANPSYFELLLRHWLVSFKNFYNAVQLYPIKSPHLCPLITWSTLSRLKRCMGEVWNNVIVWKRSFNACWFMGALSSLVMFSVLSCKVAFYFMVVETFSWWVSRALFLFNAFRTQMATLPALVTRC